MHRSSGKGPLQRAPGSPTHHTSHAVSRPRGGPGARALDRPLLDAAPAHAACVRDVLGDRNRGAGCGAGCHKPQGPSLENSSPPLANPGPQPVQGPWVSGQAQETQTPHSLPTSFRRASMRFPLETEKSARRRKGPARPPSSLNRLAHCFIHVNTHSEQDGPSAPHRKRN